MQFDHCTWDDDYKKVTQRIRKQLLQLGHCSEEKYSTVLMQGSGTFGVESCLNSFISNNEKLLVCSNGAYGLRMCEMARRIGIPFVHYEEDFDVSPKVSKVAEFSEKNPEITHVSIVHSETTSGILNNIEPVVNLCKEQGKTVIVDAMSSFGGVEINFSDTCCFSI